MIDKPETDKNENSIPPASRLGRLVRFKGKIMETFEQDVIDLLGDKIRTDDRFAKTVYQALTNIEWVNWDGDKYFTSFRGAGAFLSEIIGRGSYMDWYCCAPEGKVNDEIATAMAERGWRNKHPKI